MRSNTGCSDAANENQEFVYEGLRERAESEVKGGDSLPAVSKNIARPNPG